jgi:hypothetical protein
MIGNRFGRRHSPALVASATLVAAATILSGCGSSGGSAAGTGPGRTPVATSGSANSSVAPTGPSASAPSSASTVASSQPGGGLAVGSNFCQQARVEQQAQQKSASELAIDSPAALEKFEKQALTKLPGFVAIAPAPIKGDIQVLVAADQKLYSELAAVNFDIRKLNPSTLAGLQTPQFTKAADAIDAYLRQTCGITTTPSP